MQIGKYSPIISVNNYQVLMLFLPVKLPTLLDSILRVKRVCVYRKLVRNQLKNFIKFRMNKLGQCISFLEQFPIYFFFPLLVDFYV